MFSSEERKMTPDSLGLISWLSPLIWSSSESPGPVLCTPVHPRADRCGKEDGTLNGQTW